MPLTIPEQKSNLRKDCRQIRQALDSVFRAQAGQAICEQIAGWTVFQKAQVVLSYMPVKSEVDLRPLFELHPEKRWVLPRILPDHGLRFHPYDPQRLVFHSFGMAEPDPELPIVSTQEIELVLVPGLAYDRQGWRLGYGGGYFDRFLKEFHGTSLGVVYEALLLEELPRDEHDMPMQWLVTEKKISPAKD